MGTDDLTKLIRLFDPFCRMKVTKFGLCQQLFAIDIRLGPEDYQYIMQLRRESELRGASLGRLRRAPEGTK